MKRMIELLLVLAFIALLSAYSTAEEVVSRFIKGPLPIDPEDKTWEKAKPVDILMEAQRSIRPGRTEPIAQKIKVSSLNNGSEIAFRLEWSDPTMDGMVNMSDKFSDACAIQFPMKSGVTAPSFMMGEEGKPVHIIHWKAAWEKDVVEGYQDVEQAYPNYNVDGYPLVKTVENKAHYPLKELPKEARVFMAGIAAGNPLSDFERKVPVEELNAEGFRTLTTQVKNDAMAKGVWKDSRWMVVIKRKLNSGDPNDSVLKKGQNLFSIAIWDGGSGDTGGRKSYSAAGWLNLKIE